NMHSDYDAIRRRWPSAEAFYAERDHRTLLEVRDLHTHANTPVEIYIDEQMAEDVAIQRIALLAVNLTARWARNIRVFVPDVRLAEPLKIHSEEHLQARVAREMR